MKEWSVLRANKEGVDGMQSFFLNAKFGEKGESYIAFKEKVEM